MSLKLRSAFPADATALTALLHQAIISSEYEEELAKNWRDDWRITPDLLKKLDGIVAERNGVLTGFAATRLDDTGKLRLAYLCIARDEQKNGLNVLLLNRSEDSARKNGFTEITVHGDFNMRGFYEEFGYETVSREPSRMAPGRSAPLMEKTLSPKVFPVMGLDLRISGKPWPFETANQTAIADYFAQKQREIPELWNGRTLKLTEHRFENGVLTGVCTETSYAAFLTWRDWGAPDLTTFNLFGSAALRSSDGALLYGVMSPHTATAGQIYPPGGNLDPADVTGTGSIDMHASIARELEEETGLPASGLERGDLLIVFDGARISISQVFECGRPADDLRNQIIAHSNASDEKELADVRIIRTREDLKDKSITPYARDLGRYLLA